MIGYCAEHKDQRKDAFLAAITTDCPCCRIAELEQQLARYQGAVEVEGFSVGGGSISLDKHIPWGYGQRVRVLVMKEVE